MKVGDLVKHADGMKNVCPTTYSLGVVLGIGESYAWGTNATVCWMFGTGGICVYLCEHLEVICEGR